MALEVEHDADLALLPAPPTLRADLGKIRDNAILLEPRQPFEQLVVVKLAGNPLHHHCRELRAGRRSGRLVAVPRQVQVASRQQLPIAAETAEDRRNAQSIGGDLDLLLQPGDRLTDQAALASARAAMLAKIPVQESARDARLGEDDDGHRAAILAVLRVVVEVDKDRGKPGTVQHFRKLLVRVPRWQVLHLDGDLVGRGSVLKHANLRTVNALEQVLAQQKLPGALEVHFAIPRVRPIQRARPLIAHSRRCGDGGADGGARADRRREPGPAARGGPGRKRDEHGSRRRQRPRTWPARGGAAGAGAKPEHGAQEQSPNGCVQGKDFAGVGRECAPSAG
mmetsp:Transcript_19844/g.56848  ORF Transcript_19844/g.56848 Transcript_19844/m.56848 type:complete len:338 (-) Transcript_19844:7-1020(-)